jgi:hypothetical protein
VGRHLRSVVHVEGYTYLFHINFVQASCYKYNNPGIPGMPGVSLCQTTDFYPRIGNWEFANPKLGILENRYLIILLVTCPGKSGILVIRTSGK